MTTATRPTEADGADDSPTMRAALAAHGLADRFVPAVIGDGFHQVGPLEVYVEPDDDEVPVWVITGRLAAPAAPDGLHFRAERPTAETAAAEVAARLPAADQWQRDQATTTTAPTSTPGPPITTGRSDQRALDAIATVLGSPATWTDPATIVETVAHIVESTDRPAGTTGPGGAVWARRFRESTGREPVARFLP
ncbi:hypothetical protein WDV85_17000 [Pseudokineococcus sp. 5B2Z-1]|uniref:hypothetical protein n=1 Tax=Pseudokineococcus sp. 5B2Z-1 TaxID=3132744 RepID=UPI003099A7C1